MPISCWHLWSLRVYFFQKFYFFAKGVCCWWNSHTSSKNLSHFIYLYYTIFFLRTYRTHNLNRSCQLRERYTISQKWNGHWLTHRSHLVVCFVRCSQCKSLGNCKVSERIYTKWQCMNAERACTGLPFAECELCYVTGFYSMFIKRAGNMFAIRRNYVNEIVGKKENLRTTNIKFVPEVLFFEYLIKLFTLHTASNFFGQCRHILSTNIKCSLVNNQI